MFESPTFHRASIDTFFVSIEVPTDQDAAVAAADLKAFGSVDVQTVLESER